MKLYEISNKHQYLLNKVCDEETGEINETALMELEEISDEFKDKGIALASFIQNIEAEEIAIQNAIEKMNVRKKNLYKKYNFLSNYLKNNMEKFGINEIKCPYFAIKIKKCPTSVVINDESIVPDEYKNKKEVISLDKVKIKNEMILGVVIPGASLNQNSRLEIK